MDFLLFFNRLHVVVEWLHAWKFLAGRHRLMWRNCITFLLRVSHFYCFLIFNILPFHEYVYKGKYSVHKFQLFHPPETKICQFLHCFSRQHQWRSPRHLSTGAERRKFFHYLKNFQCLDWDCVKNVKFDK